MSIMPTETLRPHLLRPHLSVVTRHADAELARIQGQIEHCVLADGRTELEELLGRLLVSAEASGITQPPKTLDLIGHSVPVSSQLQLGDWVLDAASATVTSFFRGLADQDVLPRLGIHAVRLLGCHTACTPAARRTLTTLSDILGLEVYGTSDMILANHYDASGFNRDWRFLLVSSTDVRELERETADTVRADPYPRALDIDRLPAHALDDRHALWPRRFATAEAAGRILRLIRRTEGALMPGLLAAPSCELLLPAAAPNAYHVAQILLDGTFVRVYPDGPAHPGVLYPVTEPQALRLLLDALPAVAAAS